MLLAFISCETAWIEGKAIPVQPDIINPKIQIVSSDCSKLK